MSTSGSYTLPGPRTERARGVTDANGNVTFTWPAGAFSAPPVVALAVQSGGFQSARISANTSTSTTVSVLAAAGVTLLGVGVLAVGAPAPGVTVHAHAVAA